MPPQRGKCGRLGPSQDEHLPHRASCCPLCQQQKSLPCWTLSPAVPCRKSQVEVPWGDPQGPGESASMGPPASSHSIHPQGPLYSGHTDLGTTLVRTSISGLFTQGALSCSPRGKLLLICLDPGQRTPPPGSRPSLSQEKTPWIVILVCVSVFPGDRTLKARERVQRPHRHRERGRNR